LGPGPPSPVAATMGAVQAGFARSGLLGHDGLPIPAPYEALSPAGLASNLARQGVNAGSSSDLARQGVNAGSSSDLSRQAVNSGVAPATPMGAVPAFNRVRAGETSGSSTSGSLTPRAGDGGATGSSTTGSSTSGSMTPRANQ